MTPELATIIGAVAGAVLVVALGLVWWINRTPTAIRHASGSLPLFGTELERTGHQWVGDRDGVAGPPPIKRSPSTPPSSKVNEPPGGAGSAKVPRRKTPTSTRAARQTPKEPTAPAQDRTPTEGRQQPVETGAAKPSPTIRTFTTSGKKAPPQGPDRFAPPVKPAEAPPAAQESAVVGHGVPGTMIEGQLLRFSVPAEGTLQFLPGRLEIAAGMDSGREFRFVRVPGPHGTEVTFGRSEGELYRHIQLRAQTVSRSHARMRLDNGSWYLLNLSNTNPVVYNGRVLSDGEEQALQDGDRIEMGEVLFTFRSR